MGNLERLDEGFRGFNAAASLKRYLLYQHRERINVGFRGFNAAASLKPVFIREPGITHTRLPRF